MFSKLTILQRIQAGLVLAMAFLLVLGSYRLDKKHFSTVQHTVNSVYKDRVVVQDVIYRLSNIVHAKELRIWLGNDVGPIETENKKAEQLLEDFQATSLTREEHGVLSELKTNFEGFKADEKKIFSARDTIEERVANTAKSTLRKMHQNLNILAEIQLEESKTLTQLSNKSLGMNILLSKLEVSFLIIIGLSMLLLIFYPSKSE